MSDTTGDLEDALEEVLALLDKRGRVDLGYLEEHYGALAPQIRDCLALDEGLREGAPPRILGGYRVLRTLGAGATARVYEGERIEGGGRVALKVIHPWLAEMDGTMERFRREGLAGRAIQHPNVVAMLESFLVEDERRVMPVIVSELVEAPTLAERLARERLAPQEIVRIGAEIADGLAALHEAGIVHRDLKPGNVVVAADGAVKILDLGLAWLGDSLRRLTRTGEFVGTVAYAAPEQLNGSWGPNDGRTDLFALGVLLHEAFTGRSPWGSARSEPNPLRRHALGACRLSGGGNCAPAALDATLQPLLAPRPADRPLRAGDVRDQLRALRLDAWSPPCGTPAESDEADELDQTLRSALVGALEGRPSAVVVTGAGAEQLEAFIDAWEGRVRRGALDARIGPLRAAVTPSAPGVSVSIARELPTDASSLSRALARFVVAHGSACAIAVATMVTTTPPAWLAELERTGAVRTVALGRPASTA